MIVCHCKGISDRIIRRAVHAGAQTVSEVSERCSAGGGCGGCRDEIASVIESETKRAPAAHDASPTPSFAPAS